jgi:hypothetical protein
VSAPGECELPRSTGKGSVVAQRILSSPETTHSLTPARCPEVVDEAARQNVCSAAFRSHQVEELAGHILGTNERGRGETSRLTAITVDD